jgi:hypothetical protein
LWFTCNILVLFRFCLGAQVAQWVRSLDLTAHISLSPIRCGFAPSFVNYKKGCIRLTAASDKVYQLLDQGRWFSPGTPASFTTKTGRYDIAEILLKSNQSNRFCFVQINVPGSVGPEPIYIGLIVFLLSNIKQL